MSGVSSSDLMNYRNRYIPENLFYFKNRNRKKVIYTWYDTYFMIFKIVFLFLLTISKLYFKFINTNHDSNRT